jgi:alkylated DNA nucleotide flippase Atl1
LTTGIFTWIAAHAAEEAAAKSGDFSETTPYWRTLKAGGFLNEKYPGGIEAQRAKLETEGHAVIARGKRWAASNYEQSLLTEDLRKRLSRDG